MIQGSTSPTCMPQHEATQSEPLDKLYEALAGVLTAQEGPSHHRTYLLVRCIPWEPPNSAPLPGYSPLSTQISGRQFPPSSCAVVNSNAVLQGGECLSQRMAAA